MQKRFLSLMVLAIAVLVLAACGGSKKEEPTPPPPPPATDTPAAVVETPTSAAEAPAAETPTTEAPADPWTRIQETGKLIVGTSADYPPFEYYDENFQITGFDPALITAIADDLGLTVEMHDMAFDGLGAALYLGEIDVAIAAISVTPERASLIDFSPVYYVSEAVVLGPANSVSGPIKNLTDLASLRIGVQRGSIYQDQLEDTLVKAGLTPETNIFVYTSIDKAVEDLQAGLVDVVVLDALVAEDYVKSGGVKIVSDDLGREQYAIAYAKGSTQLQTAVNNSLVKLQQTGVVSQLLKEYLGVEPGAAIPLPTPTPPVAAATPIPPVLPTCLDGMQWVADLSYDDQNMTAPPLVKPGEPFRKGWRVLNSGTCTWDSSYTLGFVQGNRPGALMGGQPVSIQGTVAPGQTYDLYVDLVAPLQPGIYQGVWQMHNGQGKGFGARIWVGVTVAGVTPPPVVATQTPSPNINFTVDRTSIKSGECVNFSWNVNNVNAVYFYRDGQNWENNGVAGQGSRQECPGQTTTYYLRVVKQDNSVETRQIRIDVQAAPNAPHVDQFSVDPAGQITTGQCVTLRWSVSGDVNQMKITRNGGDIWNNAPISGSVQDCPPGAGDYNYGVEATGPGGTSRANQHIQVVDAAQPTATPVPTQAPPTATPPPAPEQPVINSFSANPGQINAGDCVNLAWQTTGVVNTRLSRNGNLILDGGPVSTDGYQDCPTEEGTINYTLDAANSVGQTTQANQSVQVVAPAQPTVEAPPVISVFTATPNQISTANQCVDLTWQFSGTSLVQAQIFRSDRPDQPLQSDIAEQGTIQDCPDVGRIGVTYTYTLKVDAEFSGSTTAQQTVTVVQP